MLHEEHRVISHYVDDKLPTLRQIHKTDYASLYGYESFSGIVFEECLPAVAEPIRGHERQREPSAGSAPVSACRQASVR